MKTIRYILILLLVGASNFGLAQIDPEVKTLNEALQGDPQHLDNTFRTKIDSIAHDWTNGLRDDTALYYNINLNRSAGDDTNLRLVYFLHGLGGTQQSWQGAYQGLESEYSYDGVRPYYNTGAYTNQLSFKNATSVAHASFGDFLSNYVRDFDRDSSIMKRLPPYVIGHSQGGLVARDMDMKHDSSDVLDALINPNNRRFWGIITFGTPHSGSYFAVRQHELALLAQDLIDVMVFRGIKDGAGQHQVNKPLSTSFAVTPIANKVLSSWDNFSDKTIIKIIEMVGKDNSDSITKQYGPNADYLNNTLNQYINPQMPKGLFYGVEEDPLVWRITHYTAGKDPGLYNPFTANDDSKLGDSMERLRVCYESRALVSKGHAKYHKSLSNRYTWTGGGIISAALKIKHQRISDGYKMIVAGNSRAAVFLSKINLLYKSILGSINDSNLYRTDTIGYRCIKSQTVTFYNNGNVFTTVPRVQVVSTTPICPNDTSWTYTYTPTIYTQYNETYELEVITKQTLIETPSDAVVLKPSQMAFPGCPDWYKREMNEKYDPITGTIVPVGKSKVNHMQMRNCEETKAAMMRIYNGDGSMPYFFKLVRR